MNVDNVENSVIRTIDIRSSEDNYIATYMHPDDYYITIFADNDNNGYPSAGDFTSISLLKTVIPESLSTVDLEITLELF